ncbi:MAG: right-handed parallel beta-helix repeat-containing protein [Polyangiales bacterium]
MTILSVLLLSTTDVESAHADAEVTRAGNAWTSNVDGRVVYNGARMFDAVNAAIDAMSGGVVNVRNSGDSGPDGGKIYGIRPKAGMTLDFHGHAVNANGGTMVVPIYCDQRNRIVVRNLQVTGTPRYGVWFRGCSDITLHNITMKLGKAKEVGLGIRVDASTGPARNLVISGSINIDGSADNGIETYGVDGFKIGNVTATNTGACGLLLNDSRNGTVGKVVGHHNDPGGGYATFRVANKNGPNVRVESVQSRDSGRGFFSVSGSHGTTINFVDIANSSKQGIFLEDAKNTRVLGGTVKNGHPNCQLVRTSGSTLNVSGC